MDRQPKVKLILMDIFKNNVIYHIGEVMILFAPKAQECWGFLACVENMNMLWV